jgi:hypothetical protein
MEVYTNPPNRYKDINLILNPDKKFQTLLGIGGALTESCSGGVHGTSIKRDYTLLGHYRLRTSQTYH